MGIQNPTNEVATSTAKPWRAHRYVVSYVDDGAVRRTAVRARSREQAKQFLDEDVGAVEIVSFERGD